MVRSDCGGLCRCFSVVIVVVVVVGIRTSTRVRQIENWRFCREDVCFLG